MTDSQVTERYSNGTVEYPPAPVRKLFWLRDDDTVCTLAGFTYGPKLSAAPELSATAARIIRTYEVEAAKQETRPTFFNQLQVISAMFEIYLTNYANLFELNRPPPPATSPSPRPRIQSPPPPPLSTYQLESIIVNRDQSGAVQLAHFVFRGSRHGGMFIEELVGDTLPGDRPLPRGPALPACAQGATSQTLDGKMARVWWPRVRVRSIEEKLVCETAGIDDIARDILRNPHRYSDDPAVREYAQAMALNGGQTLTLRQLKDLAFAIMDRTSSTYREVGGPRQIAVVEPGKPISLDGPQFPDQLPLPRFTLVSGGEVVGLGEGIGEFIGGPPPTAPSAPWWLAPWPPAFCVVKCRVSRTSQRLDDIYFFENQFTDCVLRYDGGPTRFDRSNRLVNCKLELGPHADRRSTFVRELAARCAQSQKLRQKPAGMAPTNPSASRGA